MPNWQDVCWDFMVADHASDVLDRTATEIERMIGERARMSRSLLGEWQGEQRKRFDEWLRQADREDNALVDDLRRARQEVGRLCQEAREEQARRERERREWEAEQERERCAREQAAMEGAY